MQVTRRYRTIAALSVVLVICAVVFARPVLLVGAVGVGAWLLARQCLFIRAVSRINTAIDVEQVISPERAVAETDVSLAFSISLPFASPLDIIAEAHPPVTATGSTHVERTVHLAQGERTVETTITLSVPVAGSVEFDPVELNVSDTADLFKERFTRGNTPSIVVEPRGPRNIHVGEAGERAMQIYGKRPSRRRAANIEPAELHEYVPGDPLSRIDWNATARLHQPYVREYEVETDHETALFVDHREAMDCGPADETKLDYVRQVALTFVDNVGTAGDSLGWYAVGDEGITDRRKPVASRYEAVKQSLRELRPTVDPANEPRNRIGPQRARRVAGRLNGRSAFETTLAPYFAEREPYLERLEDDPLFEAVRTAMPHLRGSVWTVVFTDDTRRTEVRETVTLARRSGYVLVFLTPTVLFQPGGLADLEHAYERYRTFEEFRRELTRLDYVRVFEVGPGDRLDAVLSTERRRRFSRTHGSTTSS